MSSPDPADKLSAPAGGGVLSGFHAMEEALRSGPPKGASLLVAKEGPRVKAIAALAREGGVPVERATVDQLDALSADHRGALLLLPRGTAESRKVSVESFLEGLEAGEALVLVLDKITDPHNLGAILRSADQFSCDLVVIPARRSAGEGDVVARSSAGASAHVPLAVAPNLARALELLKAEGFWIYGADMAGTKAAGVDFKGRACIVMGSEGEGLSRLLREKCDALVSIPSKGKVDSLNVSVAAGILLYEARRAAW